MVRVPPFFSLPIGPALTRVRSSRAFSVVRCPGRCDMPGGIREDEDSLGIQGWSQSLGNLVTGKEVRAPCVSPRRAPSGRWGVGVPIRVPRALTGPGRPPCAVLDLQNHGRQEEHSDREKGGKDCHV